MNTILLEAFTDFAKAITFDTTAQPVTGAALNLLNNPTVLIAAGILIVVTIFLLFFLKKVIINSILGGLIWGVSVFVFNVQLPQIPSFVIAILFGPAGIGAMLILKFFGLIV
ncbi:MAG: hypothetical protein WCW13_02000 [archaeon]